MAYSVEPARVGQRTDFDKLTLEVETNGAIDPRAAVTKAAAILRDDLVIFSAEGDEDEEDLSADSGSAFGGAPIFVC